MYHRNHNHNQANVSDLASLFVSCQDNELSRYADHTGFTASEAEDAKAISATLNPFSGVKGLLKRGG